ncbi:MAG: hypothetical protein H7248_07660 [Microbacteriaceae bacterium]|nr:hypothetical protein [Microbacteriaceae bacterium]
MTALTLDASAVVWSVPLADIATALTESPLLVLMHGRGSYEHDLAGLMPLLPTGIVFASVRAPITVGPSSYSWFNDGQPGMPSAEAADAAVDATLGWLDDLAAGGLLTPETAIGVLGFSQGGAMAVHLMRRAADRFVSYVNLAGFSIPGEWPGDEQLKQSLPPLFWGRDPADPVIPLSASQRTAEWSPLHSTLTDREYFGIAHSISREELDDVSGFLTATLLAA